MKPYVLGLALCLGVAEQVAASGLCLDIGVRYLTLPAAEVRHMAKRCDDAKLADLYYKRAYHLDLLRRNSSPHTEIIQIQGQSPSIPEYRLYIAMLEALAPHWFPDADARADFLRSEYDHRGEVVELRLRGFDRIADRLERNRRLIR